MAKHNPTAKRREETEAQYLSRLARDRAEQRNRMEPIVPAIAQANGHFAKRTVTHVDTNTKAETFIRDGLPATVRSWVLKRYPGFEEPAQAAILHCIALWDARPLLGKLSASYGVTIPGGTGSPEIALLDNLDGIDELSEFKGMFHPAHWRVFEAVVRYDRPACGAANEIENNAPQSTASARAIVGMIANWIAIQKKL